MSDVLVRGMKMPKSCGICRFRKSSYDLVWCSVVGEHIGFETEFNGRKANCPLVEIPSERIMMTWGDIYKQFKQEYPKAEATDYRPYVEGYLPSRRPGIIVWLKNGDVIAYFPKNDRTEGSKE